MKCALFAFTACGAETAERISEGLVEKGFDACVYLSQRDFAEIRTITGKLFPDFDSLIYIGSCGIAVRAVAPYIKSKATDPAVVVCDELGKHAIPLLSGHLGGANELAQLIAALTGGEAVLTTATDVHGVFSVDVWAKKNGLHIRRLSMIKEISSRILRGETVGFSSDYPYAGTLPVGLAEGDYECGIYVGTDDEKAPFPLTMSLVPKNLVVGIGCKKGISGAAIEAAAIAAEIPLYRVIKLCSIDIKSHEKGLLEFAASHKLDIEFYSADELLKAEGSFTPSSFVRSVTGVDNVCERAAVSGGGVGKLILKKHALDGVTVAVFEKEFILRFN